MLLESGSRLGPYEIVAAAGAGGMGEVYRARDPRLDRTVAIKLLPPQSARNEELRQRFHVEARAIARLQHPNICAVHDVGEQDGVDYLVLEYLEGETLEKQLERGPLPVAEALRIGAQIAAGLDAAHRAGITHRDLKPSNVMLTRGGVKLLDFGLAKLTQPAAVAANLPGATAAVTMTRALTETGTILGTFQYMAPEQLEGEEADARTDLFALGLVLYEMITGRRAFRGKSQATLISAIMTSEPQPLTALQPAAPPALERVVLRCLAKDREERWQTARDLERELEWIAAGGSQTAIAAPPVRRRAARLPWAVAAAGVLAAAAVSWLYWQRPEPETALIRTRVSLPSALTIMAGPNLSPDGKLALVWLAPSSQSPSSQSQLYLYSLASGELKLMPNGTRMGALCWSADSARIAAGGVGSGLRTIEVATGAPVTLGRGGARPIAWSREGVLLFARQGALYRMAATGGEEQKVFDMAPGESPQFLEFLPDADHFLLTVTTPRGTDVRVGSLRGGEARVIAQSSMARYAHPGHLMLLRGEALFVQRFDSRKLALAGSAVAVATNVSSSSLLAPSISRNGVITYHTETGGGQQMTWRDRSGKALGTLGPVHQYSNPAISPDGKRIAVSVGSVSLRQRDIWVYDVERGAGHRLTIDPADDFTPSWSADGRYIVFNSDRKGKRDIYRKLASGAGEDELVYATDTEDKVAESLSPDGKTIWVIIAGAASGNDIYRFSPADGTLTKHIATPTSEARPAMSPDGLWLAYESMQAGRMEIYLEPYPATGERWQISTAGGTEPQWRGDGRELFFANGGAITAVDIKTSGKSVRIGLPRRLFEVRLSSATTRNRWAPARDGQKFLTMEMLQDTPQAPSFEMVVNWPELLKSK